MPTDLQWLREVHSRIWNKNELRPQLFRTVEVTQSHYNALQQRLEKLHPNRNSPEYDPTDPDVLSAKLDFLRSPTPAEASSSRHLDDNDNRVDDDVEADPEIQSLKSLFPSRLSFLDLSPLKLKQDIVNRFNFPLLLRQEYEHISELIKSKLQTGCSVIVSGQPGTGEFLVSLSHRI